MTEYLASSVNYAPTIPLRTVAEYFAGIGLVRMGLETQGWQITYANDISLKKYELYKGFYPDANHHYVVDDIFNLDPTTIPATLLATCSFPCVNLSLAGNMRGIEGEHSSAFWGFIRILKEKGSNSPPMILVENVTGWLHSNKGKDFRLTVKALNELGYACDVFALDALRFTPQSRPRVFLVGTRFGIKQSSSGILARSKSLLPDQLRRSVCQNDDLAWYSLDLPEPPSMRKTGLSTIVEKLSESDSRWWSEVEIQRHLNMMDARHKERIVEISLQKKYSYRTFFRRRRNGQQRAEVRNDDLAGCLRTASGGSGKQFLVKAGKGEIHMRAMTPREYARLQGVPDNFFISKNGVQALTGFGDAVCVPVINWITQYALNPLLDACRADPITANFSIKYYVESTEKIDLQQFWRVHKAGQTSFLEDHG